MMAISSPQYVWTLFTGPLNQKLGTTLAELQWTFSLLIILQTWFSPFQAYLVDRFGPRLLISIGALLSGGSWVLSASVEQLGGALLHLRRPRRLRHRHHLCRHHRADGALVSRPARTGDRPCRGGLRLRRILHQFPDRQHDQELRLRAHADRVGHHPGRRSAFSRRNGCARRPRTISRASAAPAAATAAQQTHRSYSPREMLQEPGLLPVVRDDEHDVDQRAHGRRRMSGPSRGNTASPICWSWAWRRCRCRSRCRASPTA